MAGSSKSAAWPQSAVVVWEREEDRNLWVSYDSFVSAGLEEARRNGKSRLPLGDLAREMTRYEVDLRNMRQYRSDTGSSCHVRRSLFVEGTPQADGVVWHWEERGHWLCYDNRSSCVLEDHVLRKAKSVDLSRDNPKMPYVINFQTMEQTNKRTGFTRRIRRIPLPMPFPAVSREELMSLHESHSTTKSKPSQRKRKSESSEMALGSQSQTQTSSSSKLPPGTHPWLAHCKIVTNRGDESKTEDCAICFEGLSKPSDYASGSEAEALMVVELKKCSHKFHILCLQALYATSSKNGCIQCPTCKAIHGVKVGNQPLNGRMAVSKMGWQLPGFPGCRTIQIQYDFHGGIQGPEHPEPGKPYSAHGFPRTCYLPDNKEGDKVLQLLRVAWERRLIFTIGSSVTTGQRNTVVWNEIHHKTEATGNAGGHGYPDPNYISNVLAELAAQGVEDDETL